MNNFFTTRIGHFYSTNSYSCQIIHVPKKKKPVVLLSSIHTTSAIEDSTKAKPETITYYSKTKGGVNTMDKMLDEYTVKRKTNRWPSAMFFKIIDTAALTAYTVYYSEHNPTGGKEKKAGVLEGLGKKNMYPCNREKDHKSFDYGKIYKTG